MPYANINRYCEINKCCSTCLVSLIDRARDSISGRRFGSHAGSYICILILYNSNKDVYGYMYMRRLELTMSVARLAQSVEHQTFTADITQISEGRGFESHVGRNILSSIWTYCTLMMRTTPCSKY